MIDETSFDADWFCKNQLGLLCESMAQCLLDLLQTKLLYQNSSLKPPVANLEEPEGRMLKKVVDLFSATAVTCIMEDKFSTDNLNSFENQIVVPQTVCTDCETCHGEITPHNPIRVIVTGIPRDPENDQTFALSYQCQKCKRGLLVFLVRRKGLKWQLVGRNQVSAPSIPASFPKAQEKLFRDAEMAFRTGSHLASVCLLRVALEQYLRMETDQFSVCSGDQLWESYKQRLPTDFPLSRVCNLGEIYGHLSEVMHRPDSLKDTTFSECKEKLDIFFKYVSLFPLVDDRELEKETSGKRNPLQSM